MKITIISIFYTYYYLTKIFGYSVKIWTRTFLKWCLTLVVVTWPALVKFLLVVYSPWVWKLRGLIPHVVKLKTEKWHWLLKECTGKGTCWFSLMSPGRGVVLPADYCFVKHYAITQHMGFSTKLFIIIGWYCHSPY